MYGAPDFQRRAFSFSADLKASWDSCKNLARLALFAEALYNFESVFIF